MKKIDLENFYQEINQRFGSTSEALDRIDGEITFGLKAENLPDVVHLIQNHFDYCHLSAITAQQHRDLSEKIEVIYHFWCGCGLSLVVSIPIKSARIPSIVSNLPGADFYEREIAEMFGITFAGRSSTPPLLLPDEWVQGPPFINRKEQNG
jgi:NADH:ubiquinone oxidoreductase subunit C